MTVDFVAECKARLGITHTYHDGLIQAYVEDVQAFLLAAGVPESLVTGDEAAGCIARGVADLWDYGAGGGHFSPAFLQCAIQLATSEVDE